MWKLLTLFIVGNIACVRSFFHPLLKTIPSTVIRVNKVSLSASVSSTIENQPQQLDVSSIAVSGFASSEYNFADCFIFSKLFAKVWASSFVISEG
jgi:hypothetical protein